MSRRDDIYLAKCAARQHSTNRMFAWLFGAQWLLAIAIGAASSAVDAARGLALGAAISAVPLALLAVRPDRTVTRHAVATGQLAWSLGLVALARGDVETHSHAFASLAFLALYRDWRVIVTGAAVACLDVSGDASAMLEHAGWIVFEAAGLVYACIRADRAARADAANERRLERMNIVIERHVADRTRELRDGRDHYRALVENIAAVPFEVDTEKQAFAYIAPQAARLFDCDGHELDFAVVRAGIHPDDRDRVARELAEHVAGTPRAPLDWRFVTKRGRTVHVRTFLEPSHGRRQRGIMLDVTQHKRLEAELHQAQKLESVGRLASGIAHEINTPIQYASHNVAFARDVIADLVAAHASGEPLDDEAIARLPAALDMASEGLDRVASLVRSMKAFAHPGGEPVPTDLNEAVRSTLTIARNEYKYVADVDTRFGDLPPVTCVAGEINQAILNIVVNAAHAVGEVVAATGGRGRIAVETRCDGDAAVISISDTGTGIPTHIGDKVFEPFFTTKPVGTGTGQGLALAHAAIVDKHGGSLTYDSQLGVGTCFHIRLPLTPGVP